jgi:K+-sensing histidine kinase KdpD
VGELFPGPEHPVTAAHRRALFGDSVTVALSVGPAAVEVHVKPLRDGAGRIVGTAGLAVDTTARRRLEESRDEDLRTISHDLRGPLSIMSGHAQILQREFQRSGGSERAQTSTAAILRAARRMNTMIDELVDSARLEGGRLTLSRRPVPLGRLWETITDRAGSAALTERVEADFPPELPLALADAERIERVLANLVAYATRSSDPATPIRLSARAAGLGVRVELVYSGAGLRPQEIQDLFDRLHRGRDAANADGLGLELYIAKMLVDAHGGRIEVASEPGRTTTLAFELPVA